MSEDKKQDATPDIKVNNPDNLPELLNVIKDTMVNVSDSQAETKEKVAKMEVDLKEKLDEVQGKQETMEAQLGEMTAEDEAKEKGIEYTYTDDKGSVLGEGDSQKSIFDVGNPWVDAFKTELDNKNLSYDYVGDKIIVPNN